MPGWHTIRGMASDVIHMLLSAFLAIAGGMIGELWRESRANGREVRTLQTDLAALIRYCDVILMWQRELSVTPWLAP